MEGGKFIDSEDTLVHHLVTKIKLFTYEGRFEEKAATPGADRIPPPPQKKSGRRNWIRLVGTPPPPSP